MTVALSCTWHSLPNLGAPDIPRQSTLQLCNNLRIAYMTWMHQRWHAWVLAEQGAAVCVLAPY